MTVQFQALATPAISARNPLRPSPLRPQQLHLQPQNIRVKLKGGVPVSHHVTPALHSIQTAMLIVTGMYTVFTPHASFQLYGICSRSPVQQTT